jgi:cytidine deaminase
MNKISYENLTEIEKSLVETAITIRNNAYAPYSNFKVGAAVLGSDSQIYSGINIESADYTLTTHAEMDAINSMVRNKCLTFEIIVVALSAPNGISVPCGLCRQKMVEFAKNENVEVLGVNLIDESKQIYQWKLDELIPYQFNKTFL